ncbi:Hydroxyaromatic non-oxidative decarboxylaseprotein B, Hydroxyaromatic non-oxidatived ecarboxylase protein C [Salmonella enterica subsp. enterica serovar Daytona]|uniref:Hydroxyaromatic non-oxidative decarboxylaseprotein B, Hydroxyaromatic non-oxidatived ecarboxylase protein C n=1 Tax=Salmonella enterica subsp. enterica serovar Daytona TaxID=1962639 RepID=A0A447JDB5_SALET|nr:Hydroxyaromatic non-oxidative decarboxylaseprotein B, Hydroxyaromatic non-oxidatived ecarboxylase protein C [Salmonella enterica subsp. enterica serovar Daytona]
MAFDDLRSFLHALDQQGQLLKISEEVNAEPDLAAAANATGRIGDGAPALWFDNIRGFYRRPRGDEYHRFLAEPCHLTGFAA